MGTSILQKPLSRSLSHSLSLSLFSLPPTLSASKDLLMYLRQREKERERSSILLVYFPNSILTAGDRIKVRSWDLHLGLCHGRQRFKYPDPCLLLPMVQFIRKPGGKLRCDQMPGTLTWDLCVVQHPQEKLLLH